MPTWPATLPQTGQLGMSDKRKSAKVRSTVDVGPALVRRRYTVALRELNVPMAMTNAQRIIFEEFYKTDLQEGALSFSFPDPLTGSSVTARFRSDDGPEFSAAVGGSNDTDKRWNVSLDLEILPS